MSVLSAKNNAFIRKAEAIRVREHRLKPSLRLKTHAEIIEFIHDKGLVSVLGGNELPSFISAVLGRPWKPSARGFTGWMDWWSIKISGEPVARVSQNIEGRKDILATRIFRRTKTFVSSKLWPLLDTIVKHHQDPAFKQQILSYSEALGKLLAKTIDACILVGEDQISKWFEWSTDMQPVKEKLLSDGAVLRSGPYLVSSKVRDVNN